MNKSKSRSALSCMISRFLDHKRTLGHRYLQEAWVLQMLHRHVEQSDSQDLNAKCFESWLASLKDHHANTRRKWYQIVRRFCVYRQRSEPGCFLPSVEGAGKRQPYVTPIILEPDQIGRMLGIASKLSRTSASPFRAPALRLALVLLYTCGLRSGELRRLLSENQIADAFRAGGFDDYEVSVFVKAFKNRVSQLQNLRDPKRDRDGDK